VADLFSDVAHSPESSAADFIRVNSSLRGAAINRRSVTDLRDARQNLRQAVSVNLAFPEK
jgi:hypothetical protein